MANHNLWLGCIALTLFFSTSAIAGQGNPERSYLDSRWSPLHFKPAIDNATDEQCLKCHQEILKRKPLPASPSGMKADLTWYQSLDGYEGEQDTFHRRHMVSPTAKRLMNFKCNTCHQGHDPRGESSGTHETAQKDLTLRKSVDPNLCLMCHGKFDYKVMAGLEGDWPQIRDTFENDCITCHKEFRTKRHKLNFLDEEAIDKAGAESSDSCYGCHGGRSWYSVAYPYVRRPWLERMPGVAPEWAKNRPTEYDPRFTK
ncbi:MAG: hypothetical protein KZQ94_06045 [Candidatus Thiodiazotropha sp. (ex Troendleina suluensis)]|nr:hypothetical protein [Candidatus Thiodiazotropha sp. (ex Troendleina suluensis)]